MFLLSFLLDAFLLLIPIFFYLLVKKKISLKKIFNIQGLRKISIFKFVKFSLLLLLLLFLFSYILNFVAFIFNISDISVVGESIVNVPIISIIYLFIIRVFLEEWFFRGFLASQSGVLFSSFIFALAHIFYGSLIEVLGAFALGCILAIFYLKTKNIYVNFAAHSLYNFIAYIFLLNLI